MKAIALFRCLLVFCILFHYSMSCAQDWNIINSTYKYNYRHNQENFIGTTIWVDSIRINGSDTIFFLNRIVIDCDTCTSMNSLPLAEYDVAQFLQKEVIKNDSFYNFRSPGSFVIKPHSRLYDIWLYDSLNNVTSTVTEIGSIDLFGRNDSVKKISLSEGNSIELSKSYGVVSFILPYDTFTLVGIDQLYGESVPGFKEFFRFSPGDLFEFHEIPAKNPDDQFGRLHINKILITGSREHGDTLEYDLKVKHYDRCDPLPTYLWYTPGWASSSEYSSSWRFINTPGHPANLYNNQLIRIYSPRKSACFTSPFPLTKSYVYRDTDDIYRKDVGSYKKNDWFIMKDSIYNLLEREGRDPFCDIAASSYKVGLGEVYNESDGFEFHVWRELIAYRKGNDTTGIFTSDEKMVVNIDESAEQKIRIFPVPAHEYMRVELPGFSIPEELTLMRIDGRVISRIRNTDVFPAIGIPKGIYILKIEYNQNVAFRKVLIEPVR